MSVEILHTDCVFAMQLIEDNSVDAVVTDPPYGWRFMGKAWDGEDIEKENQKRIQEEIKRKGFSDKHSAALSAGQYDFNITANKSFQLWTEQWARQAFRILKPGGHMLVFCGPRTYHRMAAGVEDAGFEIRDQLQWLFGSGFPKSLNISKAIDKAAGAEREIIGKRKYHDITNNSLIGKVGTIEQNISAPSTDAAKLWDGWGTALGRVGHSSKTRE